VYTFLKLFYEVRLLTGFSVVAYAQSTKKWFEPYRIVFYRQIPILGCMNGIFTYKTSWRVLFCFSQNNI